MTSPATATAAIDLLSQSMLELWQERDPFRAGPFGYPAATRLLPQYGPAAGARRQLLASSISEQAADLDPSLLDPQRQLTREILIEQCGSAAQLMAADTEVFTVNLPREFSSASVIRGMTKVSVTDEQTGLNYLARLRQLPEFLDTDLALLRRGIAEGRPAVRRALEVTLVELDTHLATTIDNDPLLGVAADTWEAADAWLDTAKRVIVHAVRPAIARFVEGVRADVLEGSRGDDRPGLCCIDRGEEAYTAFIREEITLPVNPADIHADGIEVMATIQEKIVALGDKVYGLTDPQEIVARLRADESLAFASGDEALAAATQYMLEVEAKLPEYFLTALPACNVAPMPAATAKHYGGGQYMPGTADGTRAGVMYINTTAQRYRHEVRGMVTGGAVPGSHVFWEYAFAADVPDFRKVAFVPAFVKGWASYGGQLAHEMGLFSDPIEELGYWVKQGTNAARQVVDTGVHAHGWSRDQALDYFLQNTALSQRDAETELSRLIAMPGEGPIFAYGGKQMFAARAAAEETLGAAFDLRAFHDHLLSAGAMPLNTMQERMATWATDLAATH